MNQTKEKKRRRNSRNLDEELRMARKDLDYSQRKLEGAQGKLKRAQERVDELKLGDTG